MGGQQTIYSCSSLTGFASWYPSVCYFGPEINQCFSGLGKQTVFCTTLQITVFTYLFTTVNKNN